MRSVSIFGSTGSIGQNAVALLKFAGLEHYQVEVLTGAGNVALLAEQARLLNARHVVTSDPFRYKDLVDAMAGTECHVSAGPDALVEAAAHEVDWALSAIVGAAALPSTLALATHARTLALANKESLVCAGDLLHQACERSGCILIPVDSEHSAIFQSLRGENPADIGRLILTSSGGPFRGWSAEDMWDVTPEQACKHPNFDMGQKITIDSANMFNKALEIIEAHHLFHVPGDQIAVLVHPQQIIHSMVEYRDNAMIAQLGVPDMKGAIGFALNYPDRQPLPVDRWDIRKVSQLDFEEPDPIAFPALRLAHEAIKAGGDSGTVLNAAKEIGQTRFLAGELKFPEIANLVENTLEKFHAAPISEGGASDLQAVLNADAWARAAAIDWETA